MEPSYANSERDAKLANKPLTGNESFQLWRWQVTMGTKAKGLYDLLEDTPEHAALNERQQSRRERELDSARDRHQLATDDLEDANLTLARLLSTEDGRELTAEHTAAVATKATAEERPREADRLLHELEKKARKLQTKQDTLMFLLSKVLDTTNSIKVQACTTPAEMWRTLVDFYQGQEMEDQFSLEECLHDMTFAEHKSCDRFLDAMQTIANRLSAMGAPIADSSLVIAILKKLPPAYKPLVAAIRHGSSDQRALPAVLKAILAESKRQDTTKGRDQRQQRPVAAQVERHQLAAFSAEQDKTLQQRRHPASQRSHRERRGTPHCYRCGQNGHHTRECPATAPVPQERQRDNYHHGRAHVALYAPSYSPNSEKEHAALLHADSDSLTDTSAEMIEKHLMDWINDTGASAHMTPGDQSFVAKRETSPQATVTIGNGCRIKVSAIGSLNIGNISLSGVLLVPDLCTNLLSVSQALATGSVDSVVFTKDKAEFVKNGEALANAFKRGDLWYLQNPEKKKTYIALPASSGQPTRTLREWHETLGHVNYRTITRMVKLGLLSCSLSPFTAAFPECDACIKGKMTRPPFKPSSTPLAAHAGHTTHTDLIGPLEVKGIGGFRFILTLVDDHSRFITANPLKEKGHAPHAIIAYLPDAARTRRNSTNSEK